MNSQQQASPQNYGQPAPQQYAPFNCSFLQWVRRLCLPLIVFSTHQEPRFFCSCLRAASLYVCLWKRGLFSFSIRGICSLSLRSCHAGENAHIVTVAFACGCRTLVGRRLASHIYPPVPLRFPNSAAELSCCPDVG